MDIVISVQVTCYGRPEVGGLRHWKMDLSRFQAKQGRFWRSEPTSCNIWPKIGWDSWDQSILSNRNTDRTYQSYLARSYLHGKHITLSVAVNVSFFASQFGLEPIPQCPISQSPSYKSGGASQLKNLWKLNPSVLWNLFEVQSFSGAVGCGTSWPFFYDSLARKGNGQGPNSGSW